MSDRLARSDEARVHSYTSSDALGAHVASVAAHLSRFVSTLPGTPRTAPTDGSRGTRSRCQRLCGKEGAARLGARSGPSRAEGLLVSSVLRTATQHALFRTSGRLDDEGVHHTYQDCFHYGLLHIGDDPGHSFFAFPKKGHPRRGACGSVGRRFCARPFSSDTQPCAYTTLSRTYHFFLLVHTTKILPGKAWTHTPRNPEIE